MSDSTTPSRRGFLAASGATLLSAALAPSILRAQPAPERKLGWAVVGLGKLALGQVMPAFAGCGLSKPLALVSGHPDKASKVAQQYGVDPKNIYSYENYDTIKDNKDIDIVYNILPDSMHAEYTIRALEAGKHVLCEKPMCRSLKEANDMIAAAKKNDRKLMIAYRLHYEPYNRRAIEMARKKEFGDIRIFAADNYQDTHAPNIRLQKETGTGPLGDVGVYCINAARYITGEEPVEVTGMAHQPLTEDRFRDFPASYVFTLRFPSGALAHCSCGFNGKGSNRFRAICSDGYFGLEPAYSYGGQKFQTSRQDLKGINDIAPVNHFAAEMDHFSACVRDNKQPDTPGEEGLADMKVIEAIWTAVKTGSAVQV
jgi:predicted dehydrogenase